MKSEQSLFAAAIESAKVFNQAVREVAHTAGLLEALRDPLSPGDVVRRWGFHPSRERQVGYLLRILSAEGYADERVVGTQSVFERKRVVEGDPARAPEAGRYQPRLDVLRAWYGEEHTEKIRSVNKEFLGHDLRFLRTADEAVTFDSKFEWVWRANLTNPLYEFGRLVSVRELVAQGDRFLDLACGIGLGAVRLAEFSQGPARIVGVDKSRDFLDIARGTVYPNADVRFIERDLNTGLPPFPPASFDGILFNGAFHFIVDKRARLQEMWRVLRPGGVLALGHCFSRSGFVDEQMHDFQFSLLADRAYAIPWADVRDLVTETGFEVYKEFHRGSHSYLIARRRGAAPAPVPAAPA